MQEAVLTLVKLYQRMRFELDPVRHPPGAELEVKLGITMTPKDGIFVRVHPRN
jgi:hypothetical protein